MLRTRIICAFCVAIAPTFVAAQSAQYVREILIADLQSDAVSYAEVGSFVDCVMRDMTANEIAAVGKAADVDQRDALMDQFVGIEGLEKCLFE